MGLKARHSNIRLYSQTLFPGILPHVPALYICAYNPGSPHVVSCLNTDDGEWVGPRKVSLFERRGIAVP